MKTVQLFKCFYEAKITVFASSMKFSQTQNMHN